MAVLDEIGPLAAALFLPPIARRRFAGPGWGRGVS